jgi:hypothetical protein
MLFGHGLSQNRASREESAVKSPGRLGSVGPGVGGPISGVDSKRAVQSSLIALSVAPLLAWMRCKATPLRITVTRRLDVGVLMVHTLALVVEFCISLGDLYGGAQLVRNDSEKG